MRKKSVVEKYYYVIIRQFQDQEGRSRQELDIIPEIVYKTFRSVRYERNLHLIWYSSPDPKEYSVWQLDHLIINSTYREILTETALIAEIVSIEEEVQPQDFEQKLQTLGFHRK